MNLVAGANGAAAQLGVLRGDARHQHHRRFPTQQLLHDQGTDRRVGDQRRTLLRVLGKVAEKAVQRCRNRVQPGDQQQEADVENLFPGQPFSLDLGPEEVAEQVIPALGLPLVEDFVEVVVDRGRALFPQFLRAGIVERRAQYVEGPDDPVLHCQEPWQVMHRQPKHGEEHLRGERHRKALGEVDLRLVDEAVDQIVHQILDRLRQVLEMFGSEEWVEDLSKLALVRWVDLDGDQRPRIAEMSGWHLGRVDLRVAEDLGHRRPGGHDHARPFNPHRRSDGPHLSEGVLRAPGQHISRSAEDRATIGIDLLLCH